MFQGIKILIQVKCFKLLADNQLLLHLDTQGSNRINYLQYSLYFADLNGSSLLLIDFVAPYKEMIAT